jgi:hypothetical protein
MIVDAALLTVVGAALLGLALSVGIERLAQSRPPSQRPWAAWEAHVGLWCAGYGIAVLILGRPWCALAATSAVLITLALVSRAKMRSLREPFIFQDYEYFLDVVRYPRFFLPFLGVKRFLQAAAFFLLALAGLYWEAPPIRRFAWNGQLGGIAIVLGAAVLFLWSASRKSPPLCFRPEDDVPALGLLACIWAYGRAERMPPDMRSPFDAAAIWVDKPCPMPHLVAVQLESFFDARVLYSGIRTGVLAAFDAIRDESGGQGMLLAPAWGANTVRTEFAFLTGVKEDGLGVHRFNPYRALIRGRHVSSLPMFLNSLGYRTVCIHPYWAKYYARDKVFRQFGFDEFLDIRSFAGAHRVGPYVADAELGEKILYVLRETACPTFVFAISMENHGPLHMESVCPSDAEELYTLPPPPGCEELTAYLRHLRNTNEMLRSLHQAFTDMDSPVELCCFGDHVPIMPNVYEILGTPEGTVPYLWWSKRHRHDALHAGLPMPDCANAGHRHQAMHCGTEIALPAHALAPAWLRAVQPSIGPEDFQPLSTANTVVRF